MKSYYKKDKLIFEIGYNEKIESIKIVEKEKLGEKSPLTWKKQRIFLQNRS